MTPVPHRNSDRLDSVGPRKASWWRKQDCP